MGAHTVGQFLRFGGRIGRSDFWFYATVGVFGEWERLYVGGIYLRSGVYTCQIVLTEESFHGSGGTYAGNWAAAMRATISFEIP